jgi:hypothetical protein
MITARAVVDRTDTAAEESGGWLTRNRFLKLLGGGVFTTAVGTVLRWEPAIAQHVYPPLSPCFGYPMCHYCDGSMCNRYCWWPHAANKGHCPTLQQYWQTCAGITLYRCRDWHEQFPGYAAHHCLCRAVLAARC